MTPPTRVLHLIASSRGGGAVHVRDLALHLDRARFAVEAAMPEDGGTVRREHFEAAGVRFHVVDIASGLSLEALIRLRRLIGEADILHVHAARAALFGRLACLTRGRRRPRVVYTLHGFALPYYGYPRRAFQSFVEKALAATTDVIVAVSHAERDALVSAGLAPPERVQVIPNGIDTDLFRTAGSRREAMRNTLGLPARTVLVSTLCRLHKPRDFDTLLRAFKHVTLEIESMHLLIAGDGPLRPSIESQISQLALNGCVTLAGWRSDVPALLAASDIYALTTWGWEGLPLTVLEAMASGLPVVATDAGGNPEAVAHDRTGLLVARRDVDGLAGALRRLAGDESLRQRMGRAGQERVCQTFTRARMVAETARLYESVLG